MAARMTTTARASPEVSRPALATRAGALRATILPGLALAPRCHGARLCESTTLTLSSGSRRCFSRVVPRAVDTSERSTSSSSTEIGNLDRDYCDDFVCTSSPAVEQTVRSVARDLERGVRYTPALFARDTKYSDPFRSFSGPGPYMRQSWVQESVKSPKVTVERLSMLDKATAQIDWRLQGHVGMAPVDISHTTVIEMNLLTGKVLSLKETWDLSRVAAPVSLLVNASRASWSAKQASKDAQEGLGRMADTINSLGSTDEDSGQVYRDPTDPTKFFQQNNNQQYNDMLTFAMIMIAMYAVYQGFATVLKV